MLSLDRRAQPGSCVRGLTRRSPSTTTAVGVGLLGAFTTFSTFGHETFTLCGRDGEHLAIVYVLLSVVAGIGAAALGYLAGRALV